MRIQIEASDPSYEELDLFYAGKNRRRAISWALNKAKLLWPDHKYYSATIVEPNVFASTTVLPEYNVMLED